VDYVRFLPDSPGAGLSLADIRRPAVRDSFWAYGSLASPLAVDRPYWGRVSVVNRLPGPAPELEWVLFFSGSWTQMEVFTEDRRGNWTSQPNGSFEPIRNKAFAPTTKGNLVKLTLLPGETKTIYFRGVGQRAALPPSAHLYLQTADVFYDKLLNRRVANALFIGFLGMMLLYNIILYFLGRNQAFIYYSGYLLMAMVYACYSGGDLSDWLGDRLFVAHPQYYGFFKLAIFGGLMFYLTFIRKFTELRALLPGWDRYLRALAYAGLLFGGVFLLVAVTSNFSYVLEDRVTVAYIALVFASCLVLLPFLLRTRDKKAAFVFAGIAVLSLGGFLSLLTRVVLPPFTIGYLKAGVVLEVVIFSLGLAYAQRKQILAREQADIALRESRLEQQQQRLEVDRIQAETRFKRKFYANITHEFRTPLTVIMGMIDGIRGHDHERKLIKRNGERLLSLVNQLLDLTRLQAGAVTPKWVHRDVIEYLRYLAESFYSAAQRKGIRFMFYSEEGAVAMDYDEELLAQIVSNLVSNALKFTPAGGKVVVHLSRIATADEPHLRLVVQDSGIGIALEHTEKVFERFYRVEDTGEERPFGTGVGLSLTREAVNLLGGRISVRSEEGAGTRFEVTLAIREKFRQLQVTEPVPAAQDSDHPELLIIEDSPDIVAYLRSLLSDRYRITVATNGKEGVERALEQVPDVIISDVVMPERTGYELCRMLKQDERTSHIPIILLTAKTTREDRVEGLKCGADAYLTKPFSREELLVRLENLVEVRRKLQSRFVGSGVAAAGNSPEDAFIQKLHDLIHQHLDETEFGVAQLAAAAHLSQMQLYRKIKALTGKTPSRFIRGYRLRRGMELLRAGKLTVAEVAYSVGFADPSYFSRTFHQEFRHNPSHFVNS
jgi:signal transduction histidine kinase/DNA-binding response OmpR family regulator